MAKKLGYGLIGCGGCGERKHLASYEKLKDDVEIIAVCDADREKAERVAKEHGVPKVYPSYKELLADKSIDVVSIVTSNVTHMPIAVAALKAGKHVHIEKPIAMNAKEAQAIVEARDRSGRKLMVALNNRFTDAALFAKSYVAKGALGDIYHARCGWRRRQGCGQMQYGTWFADKSLSGGGPMIDLGVHYFDLTLHLMGFPEPVAVSASCYDKIAHPPKGQEVKGSVMLEKHKLKPGAKYDVEDIAVGFAKFEGGASVAFEFSWASHVEKETSYMELLGTKGGLSLRDWGNEFKIFTEEDGALLDITPSVRKNAPWGEAETRYFVDCLKAGRNPSSSPEDALKMMKVIDAIYKSSDIGREVVIKKA